MIKVGQKVRFNPFRGVTGFASEDNRDKEVNGTVVMVNEPHGWFSVECYIGGVKLRESFKFCDVGELVNICGK